MEVYEWDVEDHRPGRWDILIGRRYFFYELPIASDARRLDRLATEESEKITILNVLRLRKRRREDRYDR